MSICSNCQTTLPDEARSCASCGAPVSSPEPEPAPVASMQTVSGLETVLPGEQRVPADLNRPVALEAGTEVAGKYRIDRMIGAGGMGMVYKAVEIVTDTPVALKLMSSSSVPSEAAVKRLIEEGKTTRTIAHPNVVRTFDIGVWNDAPYIAMEYVEGRPLHIWRNEKLTRNEPVPARVAGQIIKEVLNGLEAAHAAGVIHRDLKPENIMLLGEPSATEAKVKIVDFGIALAATQRSDDSTGTGLGTQLYMAPEQIRNANAANAAADLYSVSKIFYELIVGVLPTGHWSPPSDGLSDVPKDIDQLIEKGLSANRNQRPQSAAAYRDALIAAFNTPQRTGANFLKPDPESELGKAQTDIKNAYARMFKAIPKWGWAVIIVVVLVALFGLSETGGDGSSCYYNDWGQYVCI